MTRICLPERNPEAISTHTPLAGRDSGSAAYAGRCRKFLLTRPSRDVTRKGQKQVTKKLISTHTPLAGRDSIALLIIALTSISTHTPLAGRDFMITGIVITIKISTHTPLAGRDVRSIMYRDRITQFLLTRPSRDVTVRPQVHLLGRLNFYSHAPRGT